MPRKERLVLAMLIASWPEPIAKERFAARVWGDDMSDESLARCISGIRRLLPHDAGVDVRAVYGFGYRLVTRQQASLQLGAGGHQRLQEIAAGAAPWVETVLHVRGVIERRDVRAMAQARDLLRALVLEASGFAPARLLLAEMLAYEAIWGPDHNADLLVDARDIVRGLERDSPGTVGLVSLKAHLCDIGWNFAQAEPLHRRALAVSPDDAGSLCNYSLHLTAFGRHAEAVQTARRAVLANPVSANVALIQSRAEYAAGHCMEAMETGERVRLQVARDPIPLSFIEGQRDYITGNPQPDMLGVHEACDDSYAFKRAHIAYHHALRGDRERAFAAMG
ncbi:MAG: winged helix-turn-helix domain-containing protein, partial [Thermaurantiacus sp.]